MAQIEKSAALPMALRPKALQYLVIGHEGLGEVLELGSAVRTLQVSDLVVPTVRRPCPSENCPACRAGWQDFCVTGHFTERGIKERHGFLVEELPLVRFGTPSPTVVSCVAKQERRLACQILRSPLSS